MSDTEQQERPKSIELTQHQEDNRQKQREEPELKLQKIVQQIDPQQRRPSHLQQRASQINPSPLKNAILYYNGHAKYNWRLNSLDPTSIVERLQAEPIPFTDELPFANDIEVGITDTPVIQSGVNRHIGYTAKRKDKNGQANFTRRYTEYIALRKKLAELWPGVFLPHFPSKTLIGASEEQVIRSRIKYIHHFWRRVSFHEKVYYSEEIGLFMDDNVNVQATFDKIQPAKTAEQLEKYKNAFPEAHENSRREQFMYKKDQAPLIFQQFQHYFGKKKVELNQFKQAFLRLADLKSKYIKAVSKLNQSILPNYENILFRWFNGVPIQDKQPSLMQRVSRKSQQLRKNKEQSSKPEAQRQQPLPVILQPPPSSSSSTVQFPNPLYNSQAYKSKLQDTGHQIQDYNSSVWVIYDVLKFQLKDIDTVLSALDQVKRVQKEIQYLKRGIAINKEQLDSLSNRKTTLKTFFMGGTEEDKRNRLTAQSQNFQSRLEKEVELYHIILALVQGQLVTYHRERVEYYQRAIKKAVSDELGIARSVVDFHVYEYQLFAKERVKKINELYPAKFPKEEEIKE